MEASGSFLFLNIITIVMNIFLCLEKLFILFFDSFAFLFISILFSSNWTEMNWIFIRTLKYLLDDLSFSIQNDWNFRCHDEFIVHYYIFILLLCCTVDSSNYECGLARDIFFHHFLWFFSVSCMIMVMMPRHSINFEIFLTMFFYKKKFDSFQCLYDTL